MDGKTIYQVCKSALKKLKNIPNSYATLMFFDQKQRIITVCINNIEGSWRVNMRCSDKLSSFHTSIDDLFVEMSSSMLFFQHEVVQIDASEDLAF